MDKKVLKITAILIGVSALVSGLIRKEIAAGLLLGFLCSLIYLRLLSNDIMLRIQTKSERRINAGTFLRLFVLAFPLLAACLKPQKVSLIGAFIGLMAFKLVLYVREFIKRKEV